MLDVKHEFERVSRLVESEVARFEQERIEDFKKSLEYLLDGMISRPKETTQAREAFQQLILKKVPGPGAKGATSVFTTSTLLYIIILYNLSCLKLPFLGCNANCVKCSNFYVQCKYSMCYVTFTTEPT